MHFEWVIALFAGYLLGSLPFAVWVARAHGVDIFKVGSGNPGATNVKRSVGKKAGNLVFALDCLKGIIAAGWMLPFFSADPELRSAMSALGFVGAALGHSYSVWLRFRGGKGVAVTMGGLAAALPSVLLASIAVWALLFFTTRVVSIASLAFAVALPVCALLFPAGWFWWGIQGPLAFPAALLVSILILYRHRSNIQRLFQGKELTFRKPPSS